MDNMPRNTWGQKNDDDDDGDNGEDDDEGEDLNGLPQQELSVLDRSSQRHQLQPKPLQTLKDDNKN